MLAEPVVVGHASTAPGRPPPDWATTSCFSVFRSAPLRRPSNISLRRRSRCSTPFPCANTPPPSDTASERNHIARRNPEIANVLWGAVCQVRGKIPRWTSGNWTALTKTRPATPWGIALPPGARHDWLPWPPRWPVTGFIPFSRLAARSPPATPGSVQGPQCAD